MSPTNDTVAPSVRQYQLLAFERQLDITGSEEPLLSSSNISANNGVEICEDNNKQQKDLFVSDRQYELPVRPDIFHKESEECLKGWYAAICPNHSEHYKVHPLTCGKIQCKASVDFVGNKRSKRVWNGNSRKEDIGLRHLGGVPFGYFVITCPKEYQYLLASKEGVLKFRKLAADIAIWAVKNNGLRKGSKVYAVSQSHACGDEDPDEYFFHENIIIPLIGINDEGKISNARHYLSRVMLERVREMIRDRFNEEFGVIIEPNFHYSVAVEEGKKRHLVKYVFRNLLWNKVDDYGLRARHLGLCNRKNKELLKQLVCQINEVLEPWSKCKFSVPSNPCPEKVFLSSKSAIELGIKIRNGGKPVGSAYPDYTPYRRGGMYGGRWNRHAIGGVEPPD